MKPVKRKNTGKTVERSVRNLAVPRKLLQLNLHQALKYNFQAHQILDDLRQKHQSDAIFGKAYIAESVIRLNEALFGNSFHLNALTNGGNTDLFSQLDTLKARVNDTIDNPFHNPGTTSPTKSTTDEDEVSLLLSRLVGETGSLDKRSEDTDSSGLTENHGIGEMLAHLSNLTLEIADRLLADTAAPDPQQKNGITVLPVEYVNPSEETDGAGSTTPTAENETVRMVIDGINTAHSLLADGNPEQVAGEFDLRSTILHSAHETSQAARAGAFFCIMGAAVFDDAAGNFIYLMIAPEGEKRKSAAVRQLLLKSLFWLDFDTTDDMGIICAGIRNLTRQEMGDHLNMLGKLLSFAATVSDSLRDERSIQNNVEYFLETVI